MEYTEITPDNEREIFQVGCLLIPSTLADSPSPLIEGPKGNGSDCCR